MKINKQIIEPDNLTIKVHEESDGAVVPIQCSLPRYNCIAIILLLHYMFDFSVIISHIL